MQSGVNFKHENENGEVFNAASEVWVKQWVDYSNKYGLGYSLNNGTVGVFFNDKSKMIIDPTGTIIEYYSILADGKSEKYSQFSPDNYPSDLKTQVTRLLHFRSYLE